MRRTGVWLLLLAVLLLWPATSAWADDPERVSSYEWTYDDGKTFINEDVTIAGDQVFEGSLGIFNGDLILEPGGVVNGDVFVSEGHAEIAGQIYGSLAVVGGDLDLAQTGHVTGDLFGMDGDQDVAGRVSGNLTSVLGTAVLRSTAVVGGNVLGWQDNVEREPGAQVGGEELESIPLPRLPFLPWQATRLPEMIPVPPRVTPPVVPQVTPPSLPEPIPPVPGWQPPQPERPGSRLGSLIGRLFSATFASLLLIGIGALLVLIWPRPTRQVADCIGALPLYSLGLGLLTFLIAAGLEVLAALLLALIAALGGLLIATIILLPVGLILILLGVLLLLPVPLALVGGMILGWVALADLVGRRVLRALRFQSVTPLAAVVVGLLLTVWLPGLLSVFEPCCLAWPLVVILLTSLGLGAVVLTRFGTRSCFSVRRPAGPPPVAPAAPEAGAQPLEAMDDEAGRPDVPPPA